MEKTNSQKIFFSKTNSPWILKIIFSRAKDFVKPGFVYTFLETSAIKKYNFQGFFFFLNEHLRNSNNFFSKIFSRRQIADFKNLFRAQELCKARICK